LPIFRSDKASSMARAVKARLRAEDATASEALQEAGERGAEEKAPSQGSEENRHRIVEYKERIDSKKQELSRIQKGIRSTEERARLIKYRRKRKRLQEELFRLERELRALKEGTQDVQETGALPDFVIIGARKAGTTFLYNLLTRHPHVEPAAAKEIHYFDSLIKEEDIEWYSRCFPKPRYENGRRTITGEATPYLAHSLAAERMARVVPQARLIALLRNPIDRAYSDYQHVVSRGKEPLTFDEAIELEVAAIEAEKLRPSSEPSGTKDKVLEGEDGPDERRRYLYRSIYIDQLLRWSEFFDRDQMLVLKSEDLFAHTPETLKIILDFLELPEWKPESWRETPQKRNEGTYKRRIDPATRMRLEDFFEPYNRRLYDYLGVDLRW
jgi:hypothetical protein